MSTLKSVNNNVFEATLKMLLDVHRRTSGLNASQCVRYYGHLVDPLPRSGKVTKRDVLEHIDGLIACYKDLLGRL
jgi:hypothetical protein